MVLVAHTFFFRLSSLLLLLPKERDAQKKRKENILTPYITT
jgi:hypothetical protein